MSAQGKVDLKMVRDLQGQCEAAQSKLSQIPTLRRVARGAGVGSGKRGSRRTYPDWFYIMALGLLAQIGPDRPLHVLQKEGRAKADGTFPAAAADDP